MLVASTGMRADSRLHPLQLLHLDDSPIVNDSMAGCLPGLEDRPIPETNDPS